MNNAAEKKKRVFNLNLDSIEFSTPPPGSEGDTKTGRMHQDEISRISNAPVTSAFEKPETPGEIKTARKDIPKLQNPAFTIFTKHKLPSAQTINKPSAKDKVIKSRVPVSKMISTIDKNLQAKI